MEERGVAMAFQTEHALFPPLQEKLVRRAVRRVTARAPLNATGQMFKGEWATFLDMAPRAGLVVHTAQGKTTLAPMRRMAVGAAHGTFQDLVAHWQGKGSCGPPGDRKSTGQASSAAGEPRRSREMRRMTVVTGDPGQLMLTPPEVKLLGFFLVTGETGLRARLG